jgi:hypothetical protein
MSRLDYNRFSQKQRPTSAAVPTLALEAGPSGASASEEQTASREDSVTPENGHSKISEFVAKLSNTELEDRQRNSTEEKKTHKCLICFVRLTQHRNSTAGLLNHIKKHHIEYAEDNPGFAPRKDTHERCGHRNIRVQLPGINSAPHPFCDLVRGEEASFLHRT